ncbi:MAG: hypothetical protein KKI07_04430 [Euryarchaeota archaeon]|nr:hypothetical protein [Euryarchaeota archaeon]
MRRCVVCGNTETFKRVVKGMVSYLVDYDPVADVYAPELTPIEELETREVVDVCICGSEKIEEVPPPSKSHYDKYIEANLWKVDDCLE